MLEIQVGKLQIFGPKCLAGSMDSSCFIQALCCLFCNTSQHPSIASLWHLNWLVPDSGARTDMMQCSSVTRSFFFLLIIFFTEGARVYQTMPNPHR